MHRFNDITGFENFAVGLADNDEEIKEAEILRYEMLILEFDQTKSKTGIDKSEYDDICDHIIVKDLTNNIVVGTYRLLSNLKLPKDGQFVCETEFDIDKLKNCGSNILELSRAVVHKDYRNGIVIKLLWQGIFSYCKKFNIKYMFGTASFHGLDVEKYKHAFTNIYYNYLADESVMCYAKPPCMNLNILKKDEIDPKLAKIETQPLIRGYFSLGSKVGDGIYFDKEFNSSDIMMIFDLDNINKVYVQRVFGVEI